MNNRCVLITGSQGFIGSHLTRWIKQWYPQALVIGTSRKKIAREGQIDVDLTEKESVGELIQRVRPDCVFHLAGTLYANNFEQFYEGNIKTTINIAEAVKDSKLQTRIILLGSAAEYGNVMVKDLPLTEEQSTAPVSFYGLSKVCQTEVARYYSNQGLNIVTARVFNVFGRGISRHLSIGSFLYQIDKIVSGAAAPVLVTGNLTAQRDYLFIEDVCSALVCLAEKGISGEIYNVCAGHSVSMQWMLGQMIHATGIKVEIVVDPAKYKLIDVMNIYGSYDKIARIGGWQPRITVEEGIVRMMASAAL
ncbi:GDP-6-deoxy-D-mannose reductase [Sporomusa ovata DSM 2662]|uniref:UDP-glucose 4-epimerase n=1 Tax=Sporomusa ovata TaxID=2378 RepID=A0A0U1L7P5_9FIRM|nr:NAD-dependent epimerase/dehydratase family protein [Sporomusa ovata]EQB28554.1 GDP-6-deoxy-D-mannose reductase [Sporomusa ovata DSM 2662]CQR74884.1 UDP-glucose 4-epimerase [Sporomusa ovata]